MITIINGIAVPRFTGIRESAVISEGENALGTIANAMEMHYMEEGEYPVNEKLDELDDYIENIDEILGEWDDGDDGHTALQLIDGDISED